MANSYNSITLVGRLGADPKVHVVSPESSICELRIATDHWNSKTREEETTWHNVKVVGKRAQQAGDWLRKGNLVLVTGELRVEKWLDKQTQQQREKAVIVAFDALKLQGEKVEAAGGVGGWDAPAPRGSNRRPTADFDDNIPF
jgi:single-strand DNA-binding protein